MENIIKILKFNKLLEWFQNNLIFLIISILLIIFFRKITMLIIYLIDKVLFKNFLDKGLKTFVKSSLKLIIQLFLIYLILSGLGINMTSLFAILGALSVVVGFAFKEIIQNIFGGMVILIFKPFKVGDVVEYKGYTGVVSKIEIFYTRLYNFQNEVVIIPNGLVITNELKNITIQNKRRLDLFISVSYSSNVNFVKKILEEIINDCEYILKDEKITLGLIEMANSSLNFAMYIYVLPDNYLLAKFYILEQVKIRFEKEGIEIPFNQLDVNIKNSG